MAGGRACGGSGGGVLSGKNGIIKHGCQGGEGDKSRGGRLLTVAMRVGTN